MLMKFTEDVLKTKGIAYYQKYPYDELAKITKNRKRHYETPDGRAVPSVTTVLQAWEMAVRSEVKAAGGGGCACICGGWA